MTCPPQTGSLMPILSGAISATMIAIELRHHKALAVLLSLFSNLFCLPVPPSLPFGAAVFPALNSPALHSPHTFSLPLEQLSASPPCSSLLTSKSPFTTQSCAPRSPSALPAPKTDLLQSSTPSVMLLPPQSLEVWRAWQEVVWERKRQGIERDQAKWNSRYTSTRIIVAHQW